MPIVSYEERLSNDSRWALSEGSGFFHDKGSVQETLHKVAQKLNDLGISYAVVGGMALFHHGFRRFTEVVDILVSRESLARIHDALDGLGYVPPFQGSKNLRDAQSGVKIEFVITGEFPGDGKPKPVAFPIPEDVAETADGVSYINLVTVVTLKLASGMTNAGRMRDLADVQELIKRLPLAADFVDRLPEYVRSKFRELYESAQHGESIE